MRYSRTDAVFTVAQIENYETNFRKILEITKLTPEQLYQ